MFLPRCGRSFCPICSRMPSDTWRISHSHALAREGADVMGIDIAGPVSSTLEVVPAMPEKLAETGRMVREAGAQWREAKLDQRDLPALRAAAEKAFAAFGSIDILFANAGIQSDGTCRHGTITVS